MRSERSAIESLQQQIDDSLARHGALPILHHPFGQKVKTKPVCGVLSTPGCRKSDFYLHNEHGDPILHISHKYGSSARDFQQYSGISTDTFLENEHVISFIDAVIKLIPNGISPKSSIGMNIPRDTHGVKLILSAIYGEEFEEPSGVDSVDMLLQGSPRLISEDGVLHLRGEAAHYRGETPSGDYEPILAVVSKGDRSQFGVRGARFSVYPKGGRPWKMMINSASPA